MRFKQILEPRKSAKDAKGHHFLRLLRFFAAISFVFFGFPVWTAFRFAD
jgi:hypothetical protein